MFRPSKAKSLLAGVSVLSLCAGHAHAQSIDYGAMQQLFGEPITTSVTGTPQRVSEAPAAMTIVTQDDIRRSGADNLPDILQFVTGIDMRRYSFGQADISVRGYNQPFSPRMLVLVNGRQVYMDDYGYVDWNAIPVQLGEIRQIEVVKGPNSALFGFNAAAGVINIITYDPLLDSTNTATVRSGTQNLGEGEATTTLHLGKTFGARISVGGFTASEFSKPEDLGYTEQRNGRLNADLRWQVTSKIQLRLEGALVDNRYAQFTPDGSFSPGHNRTNDLRVGGAAQTGIGLIDLDIYRNEARNQYGTANDPYTATNVVRVVKLNDLLKVGASNTIRAGLEYRNNLGTSANVYNGTFSYDDYAANVMWDWNVTSKLSLVNAARVDYAVLHSDAYIIDSPGRSYQIYNNTTITAPSFNSGLVYTATPKDTIHLTAARGFEMPSLFSLGLQVDLGSSLAVGTPTQSPTSVWNLDLGYERDLDAIDSNLTVDGFLQRNTDLISGLYGGISGGQALVVTSNIGSSNEAGVEIGIKGKAKSGLRWNASYRFSAIGQDITSSAFSNESTRPANGTPRNEVIAGLGYTLRRWEFDVNGRWQSAFQDYYSIGPAALPLEIGNYVTLAARVGYDLTPHITLAGSAQQFNLTRIQESSGLLVERRVIASATVHF